VLVLIAALPRSGLSIIIYLMDFSSVRLITFDCYGTLIDWETGMLSAIRGLLPKLPDISDEKLLEMYGEIEVQIEAGPYLVYRAVLSRTVEEMARRMGVRIQPADAQRFSESLKQWPPFADTVASLQALARQYKLAIISNTDDDLFAVTQKVLLAPFEFVVTAQQARSYKPSLNNFLVAINRAEQAGFKQDEILHAAQSLYHDIAPANSLGLKNVWVNRRHGKQGSGATRPSSAQPMLEVKSMEELAQKMTGVTGETAGTSY
jgi:2-haloacid dehalogenase